MLCLLSLDVFSIVYEIMSSLCEKVIFFFFNVSFRLCRGRLFVLSLCGSTPDGTVFGAIKFW